MNKCYYPIMKKILFVTTVMLGFIIDNCFAQDQKDKDPQFFFSAGYGLVGSFFVRTVEEFTPIPQHKIFYKKKFIDAAQNAAFGYSFIKKMGSTDWT